MLRSPLDLVRERRGAALGVMLTLGASLWLVMASATLLWQVERGVQEAGASFLPVIYVDGVEEGRYVAAVAEEVEGWVGTTVVVEETSEVLARLSEELGAEEVRGLGLTKEMVPGVITVQMDLFRPGTEEVIARIEALTVREEVLDVDVPEASDLAWVGEIRVVLGGVILGVFLVFLGALVALRAFLGRLQRVDGAENHLLEVFGASRAVLRRPTRIRGLVLGSGAGVMAGALFLPWVLTLNSAVDYLGMTAVVSAVGGAMAAVGAVLLGGVLGGLVGVVSSWKGTEQKQEGGMESLLEWEPER